MSGILTAIAAAGTVMSGMGAYQSSKAGEEAAHYNAAVATQNAQAERDAAALEASRARKEGARVREATQAIVGKSGFTMEGTPLLMMEQAARDAELEALRIEYGGEVAAGRQLSVAAGEEAKESQYRRSRPFSVGSALLKGAGTIASVYGASRTSGGGYYSGSESDVYGR